jgi:DNA-binding protein
LSIDCRKKQRIPDRSEKQAIEAKKKCRILLKKYPNFCWIMDDESYFTLSHSSINGNNVYYSSNVSATPSNVKFTKKKKFEDKLLVWLAISNKGISEVFYAKSGLAINQSIYGKECIRRRLIPFINKFHSKDKFVFWPDLASSHYAESVCDIYIEENINFVEKYENPANLPECRPIEMFWAILKGAVYANNWQAKDLEELRKRIAFCIKQIDQSTVTALMDGIVEKMKAVSKKGVIEKQ